MWGQVGLDIWYQFDSRIIPTRVGTSYYIHNVSVRYEDHPHACGDKVSLILQTLLHVGSSPRVWGQVPPDDTGHINGRIIPTRVGTRFDDYLAECTAEDHPHACGDKY